jgi:hypothetical protein
MNLINEPLLFYNFGVHIMLFNKPNNLYHEISD